MCTYLTEKIVVDGSGKGPDGWFPLTHGTVYVDHPQHAPYGHTLNIDFLNPAAGPSARVAVELTEESARALADAIQAALASAPPGLASGLAEVARAGGPTGRAEPERVNASAGPEHRSQPAG
jgi:hypothetical protein